MSTSSKFTLQKVFSQLNVWEQEDFLRQALSYLAPRILTTFQGHSSVLLSSTLSHYHNFWQDLVELHSSNPTPATSHLLERMPSNQAVQEIFAADQGLVGNSWADRQAHSKSPSCIELHQQFELDICQHVPWFKHISRSLNNGHLKGVAFNERCVVICMRMCVSSLTS